MDGGADEAAAYAAALAQVTQFVNDQRDTSQGLAQRT